ncbi:phage tail spike protein [Natribacillus halophilus]|uniref:Phage minor structural protein, N-terminal region n=1 Tax=Natribacillus halophilus TaxID=549003 RepID=A0A1G8RRM9_9BACI|nr:phage tail spike protein [Natribacillus halophilus]SDJ19724.1 phage minor structural protein, N-terminal region [Natribacillus halophilus]
MTSLHCISPDNQHYMMDATTTIEDEINSDVVLSVDLTSNEINEKFINEINEMWQISGVEGPGDNTMWRISHVTFQGVGNRSRMSINARHQFLDDMDNDRIYERYDQHMTANAFFDLVFEGTGYTFSLIDSFTALEWEGLGDGETRLESFQRGIDRYGAEFEIMGERIDLRERIERNQPYFLHWRLNASNISKETDAGEFWTYARGYGDYENESEDSIEDVANLQREYTSPLADVVGIRHAPPIKNGNITTEETMDDELETLVEESVKVSVTADFQRIEDYPYAQPQNGDIVTLVDDRINFSSEIRVVQVNTERNANGEVTGQNVTFGDHGLSERHRASLSTAANMISDLQEGRTTLPFSFLDAATRLATNLLLSANTELIFDNGIIAVNPDNPNEVVLFNSAGIGISDDGGQTFSNALTGAGLVADVVTAGTLRGINITGVTITGSEIYQESGSRSLELVNGYLSSYADGDLTMSFGQSEIDFYNSVNEHIGWMGPVFDPYQEDSRGIGLTIEDDFLNIGMRAQGLIRPVLRASRLSNVTSVAGPFNAALEGSELRLYGNRRVVSEDTDFENDFSGRDQPVIFLRQGDTTNDILQYFGGVNRRNDATWEVRWNHDDEGSWTTRIRAHSEGVHLGGTTTGASMQAQDFFTESSETIKTNIDEFSGSALDALNELHVKQYNLISDVEEGKNVRKTGLIAEESGAFATEDDKAVRTNEITMYSLKAIQELSEKVDDLVEENRTLRNELEQLKGEV